MSLLADAEIFYYTLVHPETIIIIASRFALFLSLSEIVATLKEIQTFVSSTIQQIGLEEIIHETIQEKGNPQVRKFVEKVKDCQADERYERQKSIIVSTKSLKKHSTNPRNVYVIRHNHKDTLSPIQNKKHFMRKPYVSWI